MTRNKTMQWFVAFAALASLSAMTFHGFGGGGTQTALAKMVENGDLDSNAEVVITDEDGSPSGLEKLAHLLSVHTVCVVDAEELERLSARYEVSTETVTVDGQTTTVAKVGGYKAHAKDIRQFLETETGEKLQCKIVKQNNWFYLLFSAHVS